MLQPLFGERTLAAMAEARRISRDPFVPGYDSLTELKCALEK